MVEFRQPLTLLMVHLNSLVRDESLDAAMHTKLQFIQSQADHLLKMVQKFSNPSDRSESYLKLNLTEVEITERICEHLRALQSSILENYPRIDIQCEERSLQHGWIDTDKMEFILQFLFSRLGLQAPGKQIHAVEVTTHLRNLPPATATPPETALEKGVFIQVSISHFPLYATKASLENQESLDIYSNEFGLSICRKWLQLHLGDLCFTVAEDGSNILTLFFCIDQKAYEAQGILDQPKKVEAPKDSQDKEPEKPEGSVAKKDPVAEEDEKKGRILVVEDDKMIQNLLIDLLQAEYEVFTADNGEEGLEAAQEHLPDLILSDWKMPKMDGLELIQQIKTHEEISNIPVVLLTAYTNIETRIKGLKKGADDYIDKPFHQEELLLRIHNLLERIRMVQRRFFKDVDMKPEHMNLNRAGKELLKKAIAVVEKNMENSEFRVEDFSDLMHMHKNSLNRKLKGITGLTANSFIRNLRLKSAARMLIEGKDFVGEISFQVGFVDQRYFSRTFRRHFGVPPSKFAEAYKKGELKLDAYMIEAIDMGEDLTGAQTA